jgi:hypothetical protein
MLLSFLWWHGRLKENIMTESVTALYDEETLSFDVPDAALKLAGSKCGNGPRLRRRFHFVPEWIAAPHCPPVDYWELALFLARARDVRRIAANIAKLPELLCKT